MISGTSPSTVGIRSGASLHAAWTNESTATTIRQQLVQSIFQRRRTLSTQSGALEKTWLTEAKIGTAATAAVRSSVRRIPQTRGVLDARISGRKICL